MFVHTLLLTIGSSTLLVPTDHATIQEAIVAAAPGDTVLVLPGVYEELIDFLGKDIVLESADGPESTIIDGGQNGPIVSIVSGEGAGAVLRGFTLRNANLFFGTAVQCTGSTPRIESNLITGNYGTTSGGAVYCLDASAVIVDNEFSDNFLPALYITGTSAPVVEGNLFHRNDGQAVYLHGGGATIRGNVFDENHPPTQGGGIRAQASASILVEDNLFTGNRASRGAAISVGDSSDAEIRDNDFYYNDALLLFGDGGAVYVSSATATIERNLFFGNRADRGGALAFIVGADAVVRDNRVLANHAFDEGGGVMVDDSTVLIERTLMSGNSTYLEEGHTSEGGALSVEGLSDFTLRQCELTENISTVGGAAFVSSLGATLMEGLTIAGNTATTGGALETQSNATVDLNHSIVWGNTGPVFVDGSGGLTVAWCDVEGGWPAGTDIVDVDPLFVDPGLGDYGLSAGSPCVDAGSPASVPSGVDAIGTPRHLDGNLDFDVRIDLGAYEHTKVRMTPLEPALPGDSILLEATGDGGLLAVCAIGTSTGELFLTPWGMLLLGPTLLLPIATVPSLPLALPVVVDDPYTGPPTLWFQTIAIDPGTGAGNFSNRIALEIQ